MVSEDPRDVFEICYHPGLASLRSRVLSQAQLSSGADLVCSQKADLIQRFYIDSQHITTLRSVKVAYRVACPVGSDCFQLHLIHAIPVLTGCALDLYPQKPAIAVGHQIEWCLTRKLDEYIKIVLYQFRDDLGFRQATEPCTRIHLRPLPAQTVEDALSFPADRPFASTRIVTVTVPVVLGFSSIQRGALLPVHFQVEARFLRPSP